MKMNKGGVEKRGERFKDKAQQDKKRTEGEERKSEWKISVNT